MFIPHTPGIRMPRVPKRQLLKILRRWPVIAGIIVGSLIILSLLFCCIRCLCCGAECCCGCLACCNACCPSPRRRGHKIPQDNGYGYKPQSANPNAQNFSPTYPPQQQYQSHPQPTYNSGPQYAQFDVSKPKTGAYAKAGNPDALPSMPTWDNAEDRKIESFEDHPDSMEMNNLDHGQAPGTAGSTTPMTGGAAAGAAAGYMRPGMNSRTGSHSPYHSPTEERGSYIGSNSGAGNPYNSNNELSGYGGAATGGYRGAAPPPTHQQSPYGAQSHNSPVRQQFASAPQQPQQQQGYAAYSPHNTNSGPNTPTYPGQRTYQPQNPRSPTSRNNNYSASTLEPSVEYPERFRPQQELEEPDSYVQGWEGGANRKPVNGSWKDV